MDKKSELLAVNLVGTLQKLYERLIALFEQVELKSRTETDSSGKKVKSTSLSPTLDQQTQSQAIFSDYRIWTGTTNSLIERYFPEAKNEFEQLTNLFSTYVLFQRVGHDITDKLWRDLFRKEPSSLIIAHIDFIKLSIEKLAIRVTTKFDYVEFSLKVRK